MTRDFDDQTLSDLGNKTMWLKQNLSNMMTNLSLLILKISFLTLIGCWVKKHHLLTLNMVRWIGLIQMTPKT